MSKKLFLIIVATALCSGIVMANPMPVLRIDNLGQQPIINNDVSASMNKTDEAYSKAINNSVKYVERNMNNDSADIKIKHKIQEEDYSTDNIKYDFNPYTGASPYVNETKSIYTDDLGRLHFFGKDSIIRK